MATELEYACYAYSGYYLYVKAPIGSDNTIYYKGSSELANTSADLTTTGETCTNLTESLLSFIGFTYNRYTAGDLYKTIEEESNTTALYVGSDKIKDAGEHGVYLGSQNTNCLTYTPKNVNLEMMYGDWTQPVLTANGTWGGSSFATKTKKNASGAYKAFDSSSMTYAQLYSNADNELYFYSPQPLKITTLDFTYYPSAWITSGEVYGSNDDSNYVLLASFSHSANTGSVTVNNTTGYKYFKLLVISAYGSSGTSRVIADIYNLSITATALNTLVLKKGSKVYVPNGKNADGSLKFDEVVVENNEIIYRTGTGTRMVFLGVNNRGTDSNIDYVVSGITAPTTTNSIRWYDTSENIIKEYNDSEWKQSGYYRTLPLAIVTANTNGYISIDQIFDWCGYIGIAIFRLPNVIYNKGDGLNNDGTYKITKYTSSSVVVREKNWSVNGTLIDWGNRLEVLDSNSLLEVENTLPTAQEGIWERCYVKSENKWYSHSNTNSTWNVLPGIINKIADCSIDVSTQTTTLTPYTAQPEMTYIPIKEIYNGSDLVYKYNT